METEIGEVTHYFSNLNVAVVEINDEIKIGDQLHFKGASTDLTQKIAAMQVKYKEVKKAGPGEDVAVVVDGLVQEGDAVYKVK
ncbi:MAG: translation elongation factor-like protein [Anaerolineae bacterium]|nr:translation elongation factor-like protein [Anaerolineae bacterium]